MDSTVLIPIAALLVSVAGLYLNTASKYLTIREHNEFKEAMEQNIIAAKNTIYRETDQLLDRVKVLESTRPTTGEIEARLNYHNGTKIKTIKS